MTDRRYIYLICGGALCGALYAFLHFVVIGSNAMMRCDPRGIDATHYMAYCNVPSFSEYDLGAYHFGLEPDAVAPMQRAEVLFLGNSRTGHAFSTNFTKSFMQKIGATYYILGFGYEASSPVELPLLIRYHLHPKAIIINADPFFSYERPSQRARILSVRADVYLEYLFKKAFQKIEAFACARNEMFCGNAPTIYRSVLDGSWDVRQFEARFPGANIPKPIVENEKLRLSELPLTLKAAREFAEAVHMEPGCIILTSVPSPGSTLDLAKAAAAEIHAPFIEPDLPGLNTFDRSHLTMEESERWSAAMLTMAESNIRKCLQ